MILNFQPIQNLSNPYQKEKRCCVLCKYDVKVDYKNARLLSQFLSPFTGKVYEKNITGKILYSSFQQFLFIYSFFIGLCKTKQKIVEGEIMKAQNAGYLAIMLKKVEYLKDPKLYDPNRPVRPHRYWSVITICIIQLSSIFSFSILYTSNPELKNNRWEKINWEKHAIQ